MIQTMNRHDFIDAFTRLNRRDQFGYEALCALFDYFEEVNPDMELDVVAICCDYAESTPAELIESYSIDTSEVDPEDDDYDQACIDVVRAYLERHTSIVAETPSGFVYATF